LMSGTMLPTAFMIRNPRTNLNTTAGAASNPTRMEITT
jgi:hypothetical protein